MTPEWEKAVEAVALEIYKMVTVSFGKYTWEEEWEAENDSYRESVREQARKMLDVAGPSLRLHYSKVFRSVLEGEAQRFDAMTITYQTQKDSQRIQHQRQGIIWAAEAIRMWVGEDGA